MNDVPVVYYHSNTNTFIYVTAKDHNLATQSDLSVASKKYFAFSERYRAPRGKVLTYSEKWHHRAHFRQSSFKRPNIHIGQLWPFVVITQWALRIFVQRRSVCGRLPTKIRKLAEILLYSSILQNSVPGLFLDQISPEKSAKIRIYCRTYIHIAMKGIRSYALRYIAYKYCFCKTKQSVICFHTTCSSKCLDI